MRVRFKGYAPERRGKRVLHRVRVEGDPGRRITLPIGPEHPAFSQHYHAAREGRSLPKPRAAQDNARSLDALVGAYLEVLEGDVRHGSASRLTLSQRRNLLRKACDMPDDTGIGRMGDLHCDLPPAAIRHIVAQWGARTGQADNTVKALRAAYERMQWTEANPCATIKRVHRSRGGATPWTPADVRQFLGHHQPGTGPHVWCVLALWTGARLSDLRTLGRGHEVKRDGLTWLEWQPSKLGSSKTAIPLAPQLMEATRASGVIGRAYVLNTQGQPYASENSLSNAVRGWTRAAGLEGRSSHGLRKALGGLLADAGATEHQIMSVLSHASPTTSAIYTKSAERTRLAGEAMAALRGLDIG